MESKIDLPEEFTEDQKYLIAHWAVHSFDFRFTYDNYSAILIGAAQLELQSLTRDAATWMTAQCRIGADAFEFFVDAYKYSLTSVAEFYLPQIVKESSSFFRSKYFISLMGTPKGALAAQELVTKYQ
jgi:hypothetical protein